MTPHWRTALHNFTIAHKYDSKASKCIGVVLFDGGAAEGFVEAYWEYAHFDWQHEPELEQILKDDFPFRPVQTKEMHRYFLKDE
jgi:hypothetical protein